jgi:hypothetical protein
LRPAPALTDELGVRVTAVYPHGRISFSRYVHRQTGICNYHSCLQKGSPAAIFVADLARAGHIPWNYLTVVCLVRPFAFSYLVDAAMQTLRRILKHDGVLFVTSPRRHQPKSASAYRIFERVSPLPLEIVTTWECSRGYGFFCRDWLWMNLMGGARSFESSLPYTIYRVRREI